MNKAQKMNKTEKRKKKRENQNWQSRIKIGRTHSNNITKLFFITMRKIYAVEKKNKRENNREEKRNSYIFHYLHTKSRERNEEI